MSEKSKKLFLRVFAVLLAFLMVGACAVTLISYLMS